MTRLLCISILISIIIIGVIPILIVFIKKWKDEKEEKYAIYISNAKLLIVALIAIEIFVVGITILIYKINLILKGL